MKQMIFGVMLILLASFVIAVDVVRFSGKIDVPNVCEEGTVHNSCEGADLDNDGDVDRADWKLFKDNYGRRDCFGGEEIMKSKGGK